MPLISSLGVMNAVGFGFTSNLVKKTYVAYTNNNPPYFGVAKWISSAMGTVYSTTGLAPGSSTDISFSPSNKSLALSYGGSNGIYIAAFPWSDTGLGTKWANPATQITSDATGVSFSPAGNAIAVSSFSPPFINTFQWSDTTGFGTKYANPATPPLDNTWSVKFTNSGTNILVGSNGGSLAQAWYLTAYPWSYSSGYGTKWANPASKIAYIVPGKCAIHPSDSYVVFLHSSSPYSITYAWGNSTGWGNQLNDPSITTASANSVDFSPSGSNIIFGTSDFPYICAFPFTTTYGTKYTAPSSNVPAKAYAAFDPTGTKILLQSGTVTMYIYDWANGFGTLTNQNKSGITSTKGISFTK